MCVYVDRQSKVMYDILVKMHINITVSLDVILLTCSLADMYPSTKSHGVMSQNTIIVTAKLTGKDTLITKNI
jgi:hypothetical protein